MQYVAEKCYLGLALDEAIKELNLTKERETIMSAYHDSFKRVYAESKNKIGIFTTNVNAKFLRENQFPIGISGKQEKQYYRALLMQPSFPATKCNDILKDKTFAMIEGFSTNDDHKRKNTSAHKTKLQNNPSKKIKPNEKFDKKSTSNNGSSNERNKLGRK